MSDKEGIINADTCEYLLKSAHDLISNARILAPQHVALSTAFNDIKSLVSELSVLKEVPSIREAADLENTSIRSQIQNFSSDKTGELVELADSTENNTESSTDRYHQSYKSWVGHHWLTENQAQLMAERMSLQWKKFPTFALFVIYGENDHLFLKNTIESLKNQLYRNWTLTVVSKFSQNSYGVDADSISNWIQSDDVYSVINQEMLATQSDWLAFLKCGDRLAIHCLFSIADYDNIDGKGWKIIYSDEDYMNDDGERYSPLFKPDLNIDYLRSYPYIGRFCFFNKSLLLAIGGMPNILTCYNESLVLSAVEYFGESVIGHIADVLGHRHGQGEALEKINKEEWRNVVSSHLKNSNIDATVAEGYVAKTTRVLYNHASKPLITVIIPTKNKPDLIEPCITSLFELTEYQNFEVIIVDNASDSEDVFYYYELWEKKYQDRIHILSYDKPFNFSAMNNYAAQQAKGEYLLLLNNDIEIVNGAWMERMLMHAQRKDVGVVGARLLFPTGEIQHAGVVVGMGDSASHPGSGVKFRDEGRMARYQVDQNFSAVTAACMMTKKTLYFQLEGLDEDVFKVLFNDVDYCLRVKELGYKIVWTPYVSLVHKQSSSLKDIPQSKEKIDCISQEISALLTRWGNVAAADPAYNKNLSFHSSDYMPCVDYSPRWDTHVVSKPRIFALPQDFFGCGNYRVCGPLQALSNASKAEIHIGPRQDIYVVEPSIPTTTDLIRLNPDSIFIQASLSDQLIGWVEQYKRYLDVPLITDIDDLKTDLPEKNCNKRFISKDVRSRLRKFLSFFDRLTVSTQPLANAYSGLIEDIVVVPNRLDNTLWGGLVSQRRSSSKPRVGWVGAQQHQGDLEIIVDVIKQTAHEIDWIFMGMCLDELKPYIREMHEFEVNFSDYPKKMADLNLDLAVAPLEVHPFNEAKSNLRLLEYGMLGWPVVCTDIYPYQNAPVKRVNNTTAEWLTAIRERIYDLDNTAREGDILRDWVVNNWILQDHLDEWMHSLVPVVDEKSSAKVA